jgi:hypothetical protein
MHSFFLLILGLFRGYKMSPTGCIFQHIKKPENQCNSLIFRLLSGVGRDRTCTFNLLNISEIQVKERAIVAKMSLA